MQGSFASPILLDLTTFILVGISIAGLLGLFLISVSAQDRMRALAWWGSAYLLGGVAVALWGIEHQISPPAPLGRSGTPRASSMGGACSGAECLGVPHSGLPPLR